MYLKSSHTRLTDGAHQWEVTLFCSNESNQIKSVDMQPKSKTSRVVGNDAKPAPTTYTMYYTCPLHENPPVEFSATILFRNGERKTVTVPANMATDRKRRRADDNQENDVVEEKPSASPPRKEKRRGLFRCFARSPSEKDEQDIAPDKCCRCVIQ